MILYSKIGTVLTNLAKEFETQGMHQEYMKTPWEGLEQHYNQENGLAWWFRKPWVENMQIWLLWDWSFYVSLTGCCIQIKIWWKPNIRRRSNE